ncbi:MAG: tetratricopeptide repeat protein [Opitutales bacterium]
MRRKLERLRPYLFGAGLTVVLTLDLANHWEVAVVQLPGELFDRHFSGLDPWAEPSEILKLAEAGNKQAQYVYALRHTAYAPAELQLKEDKALAFHWTQEAAKKGHSRAMAVLALYLLRGNGTTKDNAAARTWAERAIAKGQAMGYRVLGDLCLEEAAATQTATGVSADKTAYAAYERTLRQAYAYYRSGADAGDRVSLRKLAEGHDKGVPGIPRDYDRGTELLRRAAMRRDLESIGDLSARLEEGHKSPRDMAEAYAWRLVLAQLTGKQEHTDKLGLMEQVMRLEEIRTGQKAAAKILAELPSEAADALSRLHNSR